VTATFADLVGRAVAESGDVVFLCDDFPGDGTARILAIVPAGVDWERLAWAVRRACRLRGAECP